MQGIEEKTQEKLRDISPVDRQRKVGGGRKKLVHNNPEFLHTLEYLITPYTNPFCTDPLLQAACGLK